MADNTVLPQGTGGDTFRTLDKTGTGTPKTEIISVDVGGGDGRGENILTFPIPVTNPDIGVDDDGVPQFSLSSSTLDSLEILFRQLIASLRHG